MSEKGIGQAIYNMAYDKGFNFGYKKGIDEMEKKLLAMLEEWRLIALNNDTKYILDSIYEDIKVVAAQLKTEVE